MGNFKGYCEPPTADEAKTKIVEQWCKNTKAAHGIVPNNSWGSLQDKETRAYWKAFQCDTKAAAAPFWTKYYNDEDENPTPCPVVMGTPGTRDVVMYLPEKLCRLV